MGTESLVRFFRRSLFLSMVASLPMVVGVETVDLNQDFAADTIRASVLVTI